MVVHTSTEGSVDVPQHNAKVHSHTFATERPLWPTTEATQRPLWSATERPVCQMIQSDRKPNKLAKHGHKTSERTLIVPNSQMPLQTKSTT